MPSSNLQFGPYHTQRVLGRGGMGVVYAATDTNTGAQVAVKVLTASLAGDLRLRERFSTEIETLKLLKHPRIVELLGYGEQDGQLFYAMQLVAGRSLQDELVEGRRFTWREVVRIGIDVTDSLRHAHDHGVVHRDLKPANLLLDGEGHVMLSDFGIAKLFGGSQLTAAGGVLGTADYMSPEQAEGRPATIRSDLYSFASVLYSLLARRAPFESKTLPEVIHRLIHEEPPALSRFVADVPSELEALIHQLLQKDPQQRLGTALAVERRLQSILDEHPDPVVPPPAEIADDEYRLVEEPVDRRKATLSETPIEARPTMPLTSEMPLPVGSLPGDPPKPSLGAGVRVHLQPTVAPSAPSVAPAGPVAPPRPATQFTPVSKRQPDSTEATDRYLWLKVAALVLLVLLLFSGAAYMLWPPSADALYRQIDRAAAAEPAQLAEVESEIGRFLARFPHDSRVAEVQAWKEQLERQRLQKRFELQTRKLGATGKETPVERLYLDALQDAHLAPERSEAKLQALIDLYGDDPTAPDSTQRCVELARQELKVVQAGIEAAKEEQLEVLKARLARADELSKTDRSSAESIWRGLILLYADKPWAAELADQARVRLADQ